MPAGKEIGSYDGKFSSIRVLEVGEGTRVLEGNYTAKISGQLNGTGNGSITFDGRTEHGTYSDLGVIFLDSGEAVNGKGQGVYWSGSNGTWEIRAAYTLDGQMLVSEGQIIMSGDEVLFKGKVYELS